MQGALGVHVVASEGLVERRGLNGDDVHGVRAHRLDLVEPSLIRLTVHREVGGEVPGDRRGHLDAADLEGRRPLSGVDQDLIALHMGGNALGSRVGVHAVGVAVGIHAQHARREQEKDRAHDDESLHAGSF